MNRDEYKASCNQRACELAELLLNSDELYIDRVIDMLAMGREIHGDVWNTEFHVFGVISSDTDHLPMEGTRKFCSVQMLTNVDKEIKDTVVSYRTEVNEACNKILSLYLKPT